jgi:hexosaminidase
MEQTGHGSSTAMISPPISPLILPLGTAAWGRGCRRGGHVTAWYLLCLLGLLVSAMGVSAAAVVPQAALVPRPVRIEPAAGAFELTAQTRIQAGPGLEHEAGYLADLLAPALGRRPSLEAGGGNAIVLALEPSLERLGREGYTLSVTPQSVRLAAPTATGIFRGMQTLRQLLPPGIESGKAVAGPLAIPACNIEDQPAYAWRGLMLDTCRHFFPVEYILRYIDLLALHKMSVFHWHLTEDQGWRLEVPKYPRLTEVAAWRRALPADTDWTGGSMHRDGRYGGFYTAAEVRRVVEYAAARHILVVPEIEMPGHSLAALAAYPNLSCTGGPFEVGTRWGVYDDVYCAGKEATFTFLQDVLDEVCTLFPGPYIHIGGDECPKTRWQRCPDCQRRMRDNGLRTEAELQSWFIKRIDAYLVGKGKRLIGWDEILEGGLSPNATVMSWRGTTGGLAAAREKHDVVMSPTSHCYFDYPFDVTGNAAAGTVSLARVYGLVPTPAELAADLHHHILGAQGNVWTERITTGDRCDAMTFPRACALAEALWTAADQRNYNDFAARLRGHLARLDALGVKYTDDPLARAVEVGVWQPGQLQRADVELSWDLGTALAGPGRYEVRLEHINGRDPLRIRQVEIRRDGQSIARDGHEGQAGPSTRANTYRLTVPAVEAGGRYTLHVSVRGAAANDTRGAVLLIGP